MLSGVSNYTKPDSRARKRVSPCHIAVTGASVFETDRGRVIDAVRTHINVRGWRLSDSAGEDGTGLVRSMDTAADDGSSSAPVVSGVDASPMLEVEAAAPTPAANPGEPPLSEGHVLQQSRERSPAKRRATFTVEGGPQPVKTAIDNGTPMYIYIRSTTNAPRKYALLVDRQLGGAVRGYAIIYMNVFGKFSCKTCSIFDVSVEGGTRHCGHIDAGANVLRRYANISDEPGGMDAFVASLSTDSIAFQPHISVDLATHAQHKGQLRTVLVNDSIHLIRTTRRKTDRCDTCLSGKGCAYWSSGNTLQPASSETGKPRDEAISGFDIGDGQFGEWMSSEAVGYISQFKPKLALHIEWERSQFRMETGKLSKLREWAVANWRGETCNLEGSASSCDCAIQPRSILVYVIACCNPAVIRVNVCNECSRVYRSSENATAGIDEEFDFYIGKHNRTFALGVHLTLVRRYVKELGQGGRNGKMWHDAFFCAVQERVETSAGNKTSYGTVLARLAGADDSFVPT